MPRLIHIIIQRPGTTLCERVSDFPFSFSPASGYLDRVRSSAPSSLWLSRPFHVNPVENSLAQNPAHKFNGGRTRERGIRSKPKHRRTNRNPQHFSRIENLAQKIGLGVCNNAKTWLCRATIPISIHRQMASFWTPNCPFLCITGVGISL